VLQAGVIRWLIDACMHTNGRAHACLALPCSGPDAVPRRLHLLQAKGASGAVSAASKSPKKGSGGKDSRAGEDNGRNRTDGDGAAQSGRRKKGSESGELQKGGKDAADGDGPGDAGDETEDEEEEQGSAGKGREEATAGRASAGAAGDKSVDIDKLKKEVEERGGYARVEERREWRQIARAIGVPHNACDHAHVMLRREFIAAGGEGEAKKRGRPKGSKTSANKAAKSLAGDESEQRAKRAKGKAAADAGDAGGAPGAPAVGLALLGGFAGDMNVNVGGAGWPQGAQDLLQWQQQAFLMQQQQQALGANAGMAVLHQVSLRVFPARS
jgi:hypothetical protein